jgi:hypothetical protein
MVEATRHLLHQNCDIFDFAADVLGVQAVSFPSHVEQFRARVRMNPWAKLGADDRRGGRAFSRSKPAAEFPATSLSQATTVSGDTAR